MFSIIPIYILLSLLKVVLNSALIILLFAWQSPSIEHYFFLLQLQALFVSICFGINLYKKVSIYIKSYIRDDIEFPDKTQKDIDDSETLLTLDATSVYTIVDNQLGVEAITYLVFLGPKPFTKNCFKRFYHKFIEYSSLIQHIHI